MEHKLQALEICMAEFKKEISFIKRSQDESKEQNSREHREIIEKIDDFIKSCDGKYARIDTQWAEKILSWFGAIVGSTLIIGIIGWLATLYLKTN